MPLRIDAHHHFIDHQRFDYPWLGPDLQVLHSNFGLNELQPHLHAHQIDRSIAVQTISSLEETRHFLDIASADNPVAGVIGWVDLQAADIADTVVALRAHGPLLGIRHQVHDEIDPAWLLQSSVINGLRCLSRMQVPYDLLIKPEHVNISVKVARQLPELTLIVDHIAKPAINSAQFDQGWADGIKQLAACPNVWCKLSGMITEADWSSWTADDLRPYIATVIEAFGVERLIFGSDWPVCLLAGDYNRVIHALECICEDMLSVEERGLIFGGNAMRCYQIK